MMNNKNQNSSLCILSCVNTTHLAHAIQLILYLNFRNRKKEVAASDPIVGLVISQTRFPQQFGQNSEYSYTIMYVCVYR